MKKILSVVILLTFLSNGIVWGASKKYEKVAATSPIKETQVREQMVKPEEGGCLIDTKIRLFKKEYPIRFFCVSIKIKV